MTFLDGITLSIKNEKKFTVGFFMSNSTIIILVLICIISLGLLFVINTTKIVEKKELNQKEAVPPAASPQQNGAKTDNIPKLSN